MISRCNLRYECKIVKLSTFPISGHKRNLAIHDAEKNTFALKDGECRWRIQ